jgi:type I restriction enzyme R subunit
MFKPMFEGPEKQFQKHIADFLVREHKFAVLTQEEITDTEFYFAEDHLYAFLKATQAETLKRLETDYGSDSRDEIFKALREEVGRRPLWSIIRTGLRVRGHDFKFYFPKPRSSESVAHAHYEENRITFKPELVIKDGKRPDFVFFLNGLPIVTVELKHEKNQNVHDAVAQYVGRNHSDRIFQLPFLHIAADTSDVQVATDPRDAKNFRWFNTGLSNAPQSEGEYPVEFLYREVLSKERLLESLAFFLIHVPKRDAVDDKPARAAFTLHPRYHQGRLVRKLAAAVNETFDTTGEVGGKYLVNHSAGSGKTLTICWLADRLHSLYKTGTSTKLLDMVFILTDRKSLDKNIRDEIENFAHLHDVVGIAKRANDLPDFIAQRKSIIVTTQQKFAWVLEKLQSDPALKNLRVAFLIDEAHRSQEGKMGAAIRVPFRDKDDADADDAAEEAADEEDNIAKIIREHDSNQLFVAFTATPAQATVDLFGEAFDTYSEAEAIAEGYIVDVATSILSYSTLYHLKCKIVPTPDQERVYPAGVVSKALKNVAFADDGLIQYKAEVMLRIFEENVKSLVGGRAKAMIVTSSRVAGLRYFRIIQEKLKERGADYKVLYAFSDFVHPETNEAISEHAVNGLSDNEQIEDRFEGEDYRLMVVANKFQTGFDQPLLAGMFLDKPVVDRNAVQTVSRLNRCHLDKGDVVVVDFTNNAKAILKAFKKYRKGTPFEPGEPDENECLRLMKEILDAGVFTQQDAAEFVEAVARHGIGSGWVSTRVNGLRTRFNETITDPEQRKAFVYLLAKFVKSVHFLTCFFTYPDEVKQFAAFAELVGPQLIKEGTVSELMKLIRATEVVKASVQFQGEVNSPGVVKLRPGKGNSGGPPPKKVTVQDMIDQIRQQFTITDEEAIYIKEVTAAKQADPGVAETVTLHRTDLEFLNNIYHPQLNGEIQNDYITKPGGFETLADPKFVGPGAIFDIMAVTVIEHHLDSAA